MILDAAVANVMLTSLFGEMSLGVAIGSSKLAKSDQMRDGFDPIYGEFDFDGP